MIMDFVLNSFVGWFFVSGVVWFFFVADRNLFAVDVT